MERSYDFEHMRFLIRWAFILGVAVGLLISLVWQAFQRNHFGSPEVYNSQPSTTRIQLKP